VSVSGASGWLDPAALTIVAVLDGKPVGLVRGGLEDGATWLHSLWVGPHLRGHGLGGRLVIAVENWAHPRTALVRLSVVAANTAAIALYRRHGFIESRLPADEVGELVMEKALDRTHQVRPGGAPR
jgi:ribosomal protein S18 acetylase RimI-like enzyme